MASISLFSVGKSVLDKLGPLVQQEAALLWNLRTELEKLEGTVSAIQALLLDAEEQQEHSHRVKDWLEKLQVLLFDAEDLLDDVATEALRKEVAARHRRDDDCRVRCWTAVCFLFSLTNQLLYGLKMAHKVKSLREQLDAIYDDNTKLQLNPRFEEKGKMRKHSPTMSSIPDIFVGREDDLKQIKQLLSLDNNNNNSRSNISVVSIVGIGGMGKTALAQLIYNDRDIREHFKLRLWACVSESFEVKVIISKILESGTKEKKQDLELETLASLLGELIGEKKYFLVLDDVWNFDPEEWGKLRSVLNGGASGSKILVTTQFQNFARTMSRGSPDPPYALSGLSSPQSWSLFNQVVFGGDHNIVDEELQSIINVEDIKSEIMKKSAGVPLAVKTVANLCSDHSKIEWLPFLRSNKLLDAEHKDSIAHNLKLSYNYLPSHLKHCFALCSLYPKDREIAVDSLICLWATLGVIKASPDDCRESLFDSGLRCFMDLTWRSFFQEIKRDWDNEIRSCKMHDLIHDLAISVAGSSCQPITGPTDIIDKKARHISMNHSLWSPSEILGKLDKAKQLRTFYVQHERWYNPGTNWDGVSFETFISKFESLRVLEFLRSPIETIPDRIQELKHLRHLNLAYNSNLTRLPNSITMLQNLQVLNLFACKTLQELPRYINKLVNLWFLSCRDCFALTHMPVGLGELTRLERLTCFVVGKDSFDSKHIGGLNELSRLHNLRGELQIVNLGHLRSTKILSPPSLAFKIGEAANLKGKLRLDALVLFWGSGDFYEQGKWEHCLKRCEEDDEWDESLLESLQPHSNLKSFAVIGYKGGRSPSWLCSLTNLVTLQLYLCKVRDGLQHVQVLPVLQRLTFRKLMELEYVDEDEDAMSSSMDEGTQKKASKPFFPSLLTLKLMSCPKLKGWRRTSSQFPKLSKLVVLVCPLLTSMPLFPTLEKKLELKDTSIEPLVWTMNHTSLVGCRPSSSSSSHSASSSQVDELQYPLSKLKKLHISRIHHLPTECLQGIRHLTSLQHIKIENCSGLEEAFDLDSVDSVPDVTITGTKSQIEVLFGLKVTVQVDSSDDSKGLNIPPILKMTSDMKARSEGLWNLSLA